MILQINQIDSKPVFQSKKISDVDKFINELTKRGNRTSSNDVAWREKVPCMLAEGWLPKRIADNLGISTLRLQGWLNHYSKLDIIKWGKQAKFMQEIKSLVDAGMTTTQIANHYGKHRKWGVKILKMFGYQTKKDESLKNLDDIVDEVINHNLPMNDAAKKHGIARETILRRIKKLYGKTYIEIKKENNT